MYTIDKGIPLPARLRGRTSKYPFSLMGVGDSFLVQTATDRNRAISAFSNWSRKPGNKDNFQLLTAKADGGYRCWLIRKNFAGRNKVTPALAQEQAGIGLHALLRHRGGQDHGPHVEAHQDRLLQGLQPLDPSRPEAAR